MKRTAAAALACLLLATACATKKKEPPPKPFAATRWQLVMEVPLAGELPWVRFGDGRMEGFGGCNRIAARYVQDTVGARALVIGRIDTGTRACDPSARIAEERLIEVLQAVSSYAIRGPVLTMTGSAGTIRFRAEGAKDSEEGTS